MALFRLIHKDAIIIQSTVWLPLITGCNKLIDAGSPDNKVITSQVYTSDSLAQAALIGVYYKIMATFGPHNGYISRYAGLSADELDRTSVLVEDQPFVTNTLTPDNTTIWQLWVAYYSYIYQCNDLVTGLADNKIITPALRNQLLGEAYFLRAFSYFYLVNLYGDVPLVLTTDYTKNERLPRTSVEAVYGQMITDLHEAQDLLTNAYVTTPNYPSARVRVNRLAVKALLARIHLYRGQWTDAAAAATEVISSGSYQLETDLQQTFRYNSKEAILQFMPVSDAYNTAEGAMFIPVIPNGKPAIVLGDSMLKNMEPADARRSWIRTVTISGKQYNSPFKYKLNTGTPREEYNIVLRLAEQYCIRAEALAMLNQLPEAVSDVNMIRKRAGLSALTNVTLQTQALAAVEQERRMELFAEWGHRWFDLKRMPSRSTTTSDKKRIEEVMPPLRSDTWKPTAVLWPIPEIERTRNASLTQNPGYD